MSAPPLAGRVALLTGASGALGRHLAETIVKAGASIVACHWRSPLDTQSWSKALLHGQRVIGVQADLSRSDGVDRAFDEALQLGGCDLLINSASILNRDPFEKTSRQAMDALVAINLISPMACCQAALAQMRAKEGQGRCDIVNLLDVGGAFIPWKRGAAYCATRAALAMLTRCLALECAPHIRVNAIAPGILDLPPAPPMAALENIPMGRPGTVAELEAALLFLLTGPASMTGQILAVDGGRSARRR
ncbi:MAG: SDR family oxidoreductase [Myxococcales bacterium]|jgi:pteridine reductase|nr:SDR family oxidoreductase [Myxococcales bacterium]